MRSPEKPAIAAAFLTTTSKNFNMSQATKPTHFGDSASFYKQTEQ
jgi:hypothetical protein